LKNEAVNRLTAQNELTKRKRLPAAALTLLTVIMVAAAPGCKRHSNPNLVSAQSEDVTAEQAETLSQLTHQLRRTMVHQKLTGTFEDFEAARTDLTIPPPPPGKKYAISKKWTVVLVDDKK
jgi:hypothetical protein